MKFSIKREELISILSEYTNILKENPIKPIVSGLQIKAESNLITFVGTNLEVDHIRKVEADVKEEGSLVLKPFLLLEYIKLLDEEYIEFILNNGFITVHHAEFSILEEGTFPIITETTPIKLLSINGGEFVKLLEKSKFAASLTSDNIQINCVRAIFKLNEINSSLFQT